MLRNEQDNFVTEQKGTRSKWNHTWSGSCTPSEHWRGLTTQLLRNHPTFDWANTGENLGSQKPPEHSSRAGLRTRWREGRQSPRESELRMTTMLVVILLCCVSWCLWTWKRRGRHVVYMSQFLIVGIGCRGGKGIGWARWCVFFGCSCNDHIVVWGFVWFVPLCIGVMNKSAWRGGSGELIHFATYGY
jgi:hypothetical protein